MFLNAKENNHEKKSLRNQNHCIETNIIQHFDIICYLASKKFESTGD